MSTISYQTVNNTIINTNGLITVGEYAEETAAAWVATYDNVQPVNDTLGYFICEPVDLSYTYITYKTERTWDEETSTYITEKVINESKSYIYTAMTYSYHWSLKPEAYMWTTPTVEFSKYVAPTEAPTSEPTTEAPTSEPTTEAPTEAPTSEPTTEAPTSEPTTEAPTSEPIEYVTNLESEDNMPTITVTNMYNVTTTYKCSYVSNINGITTYIVNNYPGSTVEFYVPDLMEINCTPTTYNTYNTGYYELGINIKNFDNNRYYEMCAFQTDITTYNEICDIYNGNKCDGHTTSFNYIKSLDVTRVINYSMSNANYSYNGDSIINVIIKSENDNINLSLSDISVVADRGNCGYMTNTYMFTYTVN